MARHRPTVGLEPGLRPSPRVGDGGRIPGEEDDLRGDAGQIEQPGLDRRLAGVPDHRPGSDPGRDGVHDGGGCRDQVAGVAGPRLRLEHHPGPRPVAADASAHRCEPVALLLPRRPERIAKYRRPERAVVGGQPAGAELVLHPGSLPDVDELADRDHGPGRQQAIENGRAAAAGPDDHVPARRRTGWVRWLVARRRRRHRNRAGIVGNVGSRP